MDINEIAEVCYEVNRAYCKSLGDTSHAIWSLAPEWQKETNVKGVEFHIENPNSTPQSSHESWLTEKAKNGWKFGLKKDPEKKEHPCFVPYLQLPFEQKAKDFIFLSVVRSLQKHLVIKPPAADSEAPPEKLEKVHMQKFNRLDEIIGEKIITLAEFQDMETDDKGRFWFNPEDRLGTMDYWKLATTPQQ